VVGLYSCIFICVKCEPESGWLWDGLGIRWFLEDMESRRLVGISKNVFNYVSTDQFHKNEHDKTSQHFKISFDRGKAGSG